ncbi:MAG: hypothetical protein JOZ65_05125 [Chloroflexi bacterium]|nr:hypothetical protein [Chloroflexota bacterium]
MQSITIGRPVLLVRARSAWSHSSGRVASRAPASKSASLELALAGLTIGLIFGFGLILPVPFWRAQPASPLGSGQVPAAGLGWPAALLAIGFAAVLCAPYRPYVLAMRAARRVPTRALLLLTAVLAVLALLVYPAFGSDLFVYLDYERLFAVYGVNPLLAFPNLHPEDWAYHFTWIADQPSPYGPLWPLLTWPIARAAADSLWAWIFGYKLLALLSYVTCCWLIWHSVDADRRKRALIAFAWSPLVLFDLLGKAHNDGLLAVSAVAAVLLARRSSTVAMLGAVAGLLIKLSGFAVAMAIWLGFLRERRWQALALATALAVAACAALYAPFWAGAQTLQPVLFQTNRVVWSPGALLIAPGFDGLLARAICALAFLGICVWVTARRTDLVERIWIVQLAALLLLTTAFFAHYLIPVVALAAISGDWRLERLTLALSIGALAAYAVELLAPAFDTGWIGSPAYQIVGSVVTLGPAAIALLTVLGGRLRTKRLAVQPQLLAS